MPATGTFHCPVRPRHRYETCPMSERPFSLTRSSLRHLTDLASYQSHPTSRYFHSWYAAVAQPLDRHQQRFPKWQMEEDPRRARGVLAVQDTMITGGGRHRSKEEARRRARQRSRLVSLRNIRGSRRLTVCISRCQSQRLQIAHARRCLYPIPY